MTTKTKTIGGYTFRKISEDTYMVTFPDGHTQEKYWTAAEGLMKQIERKFNPPKSEVYTEKDDEWHKLHPFAETLDSFQNRLRFVVNNCYKDAGAGTTWTTIVAKRPNGDEWMFLTPAEQKELLSASYTDFSRIISKTISRIKEIFSKDSQSIVLSAILEKTVLFNLTIPIGLSAFKVMYSCAIFLTFIPLNYNKILYFFKGIL